MAFIECPSEDNARAVKDWFDNNEFQGKRLQVNIQPGSFNPYKVQKDGQPTGRGGIRTGAMGGGPAPGGRGGFGGGRGGYNNRGGGMMGGNPMMGGMPNGGMMGMMPPSGPGGRGRGGMGMNMGMGMGGPGGYNAGQKRQRYD